MLAYYFFLPDVKNMLWTVIFSIILTDDRFLSLGFHYVCAGDKRKTDVSSVCARFFFPFHRWNFFFFIFFNIHPWQKWIRIEPQRAGGARGEGAEWDQSLARAPVAAFHLVFYGPWLYSLTNSFMVQHQDLKYKCKQFFLFKSCKYFLLKIA